MDSRIWSAVLVQTYGLGFSFQVFIQARMSVLRARTLGWAPRWSFLVVSSENHRSTRLSHELEVGVKCTTKRGWARSQRWIAGVLWVETLSITRCTARWSGTSLSMVVRNFLNSIARCRACSWPMTLPVVMSRAAYRLDVPCRV